MTVRELIETLLDYDMDHEVQIELQTSNDNEFVDFSIDDNFRGKEVYLVADFGKEALVEADRLEELEEKEERLEELEES